MGGGGKSSGGGNQSAELYAKQQADLAAQREKIAADELAAKQAEQAKRDELRDQMLRDRNQLYSEDDEDAAVVNAVLGGQ